MRISIAKLLMILSVSTISLHSEPKIPPKFPPSEWNSLAIRYNEGNLSILNQQKLPLEEEWIDVQSPEQMVEIIRALKVRGAPMIGVSAVFALAQMAQRGASV